jgi:pyrroloquinoline quinone biosynthesis protein B
VKIRVLGSAAGGGFPQWNCNCRNCSGVRTGTLRARRRTQSSLIVSGPDERHFALVNASPDILAQIAAQPLLQPARAPRDTAVRAVVLVDGQIDHAAGLLMLRESTRPLTVWCTERVREDLTRSYPVFPVLEHYCGVEHRELRFDGRAFALEEVAGVEWQALAVAGKPAPYSPNRTAPKPGDNVALVMRAAGRGTLVYAPGLGKMEEGLWAALGAADCVLLDGTFWSDEEMIRQGLSRRSARELGHLPLSGAGGMLEWLEKLPETTRRILIHVNNTNPILDEDSPERAELVRHGVEVAWDGMEVEL